jgi:hypothetical protein
VLEVCLPRSGFHFFSWHNREHCYKDNKSLGHGVTADGLDLWGLKAPDRYFDDLLEIRNNLHIPFPFTQPAITEKPWMPKFLDTFPRHFLLRGRLNQPANLWARVHVCFSQRLNTKPLARRGAMRVVSTVCGNSGLILQYPSVFSFDGADGVRVCERKCEWVCCALNIHRAKTSSYSSRASKSALLFLACASQCLFVERNPASLTRKQRLSRILLEDTTRFKQVHRFIPYWWFKRSKRFWRL